MVKIRTEVQVLLVLAFLIVVFFANATITGLYSFDHKERVIVILNEPFSTSNLISGAVTGSDDVKSQVLNDVKGGFFTTDVKDSVELDLPVLVVETNKNGLRKLEQHPLVKEVIPDFELKLLLNESTHIIRSDVANILSINGTYLDGSNITVCYIDTGIDHDHPAFMGRILREKCFCQGCCQGSSESDDASDTNGHGTHVAGIIGANGTVKGVAPNVNLVAVRTCSNGCMLGDVLAGIDFCVANKDQYNIDVISISIGDGGNYVQQNQCPTYLDSAISAAFDNNISMFIAAGNEGYGSGVNYPGCSPTAVAVGATNDNDVIASWSNRGSLMEILAPGQNIYSTKPNTYGLLSGTSMSTPHVAGAAAILYQYAKIANQTLSPSDVLIALQASNTTVESWPRLDVMASLEYLGLDLSNSTNSTNNQSNSTNSTNTPVFNYNITNPQNNLRYINPVQFSLGGNLTNATIVWIYDNSTISNTSSFSLNFSLGNHSVDVFVTKNNVTLNKSVSFRIIPQTYCAIDLDLNSNSEIDVGDVVLLNQLANFSCITPTSEIFCLYDLEAEAVTKTVVQKTLDNLLIRNITDVYGNDCDGPAVI